MQEISKDESNHVKISLSEVLFQVSPFCSTETKTTGILEVVKTLLKDTDIQVRLKLINNIHIFNK